MTGICGIVGSEDKTLAKKMSEVMKHRGIAQSTIFTDRGVVLIQYELANRGQPSKKELIHNEDESIWIVLDGKINNKNELQGQLENEGHVFATTTDAEVVVHSYEVHGELCAQKLKGEFTFAVWDNQKKSLLLARDRVGVKPLFYTKVDDEFIFSSEIKGILQHENILPETDLQALHYFLSLRFIPGEHTMFKGIKKLLPGHILMVENGRIKVSKYCDLAINPTQKSEEYYIKNIQELYKQAVLRRLEDAPLGVSLSGGIDSSATVALLSELTDEPIKTFSMAFGEPTDELTSAQFVADYFETDHHTTTMDYSEVGGLLPSMVWHTDDPLIDPQRYILYRFAKEYVDVIYNGGGGDELFGGYHLYMYLGKVIDQNKIHIKFLKTKLFSKLVSQFVNAQLKLGGQKGYEYRRRLQFLGSLDDRKKVYLLTRNALNVEDEMEKIYSKSIDTGELGSVNDYFDQFFTKNSSFLDQVIMAEFNTKLPDKELLSEDRMSMAHSLISPAPLLDTDIVDFVFTIPSNLKVKNGTTKYIFKKAMSDRLPDEILNKPKWGFAYNPLSMFKEGFKEYAEIFLSEENVRKRGLFNYDYIQRILKHPIDPKLKWHYNFITGLLAVEIWHRIYVDQQNLFKPKLDIDKLY